MAERGLAYGPAFQVLRDLHRGVDDAVASVQLPESVLREAAALSAASGAGRRAAASRWPAPCRSKKMARSARSRTCRSAFAAFALLRPIEDYAQPLFTYARAHQPANRSPARNASKPTSIW